MAGSDCLYRDPTCWVYHYLLEFREVGWDLVVNMLHSMNILDRSVYRSYLTGPLSPNVGATCFMPKVN